MRRSYFFQIAFVVLMALALSTPAKAFRVDPVEVYSRSIMPSCNFVYSVESDIKIVARAEAVEGSVLLLAWDNAWTDEVEFENPVYLEPHFKSQSRAEMVWEVSIQSMSTSESFLRRKMFLRWGEWAEDGEFRPLSKTYWADIGRRFGETCQSSRGPQVPFHLRELRLLELRHK